MLNKDSKILRNSKVPWRIIEDEGILVDVSKGEVIHLNPIAASIWEKIDEQTTVGNIIDEIDDLEFSENFTMDVLILDYPDILSPSVRSHSEGRDQIDYNWKSSSYVA